jgi:CTP synthase (UTP-ammonia lyase)
VLKAGSKIQIGLVGDYDASVTAHVAIPKALAIAAAAEKREVEAVWLATQILATDVESQLQRFNGIWCVPGSPYQNRGGALNAIRFAREQRRPFLGTCGGFQHTLIEYARNVRGLSEADHAESGPAAVVPLITPLVCALRETGGKIRFRPHSRAGTIYGCDEVTEEFNCGYGLNRRYDAIFKEGPLRVSGVDGNGEVRVVELNGHPFFVATLFQPERSALRDVAHPLVCAFVNAACAQTKGG